MRPSYLTCKCRGQMTDIHYVIHRRSHLDHSLNTVDPTSAQAWYLLRFKDTDNICRFLSRQDIGLKLFDFKFAELEGIWFSSVVCKAELPLQPRHRSPASLLGSKMRQMLYDVTRSFYRIDISCNEPENGENIELRELNDSVEGSVDVMLLECDTVDPLNLEAHSASTTRQHDVTLENVDRNNPVTELERPANQTEHQEVRDVSPFDPATNRRDPFCDPEEVVPVNGETIATRLKQYLRSCVSTSTAYFTQKDTLLSKIYALDRPVTKYHKFFVFTDFSYFPYCDVAVVLSETTSTHLPSRKRPYIYVQTYNTLDFTIGERNLSKIHGLPIDQAYQLLKSVIGLKGYIEVKSPSD